MIIKTNSVLFKLKILNYSYEKNKCEYNPDGNWVDCLIKLKTLNINISFTYKFLIDDIKHFKTFFSKQIHEYVNLENTFFINHITNNIYEFIIYPGDEGYIFKVQLNDKDFNKCINEINKELKNYPERNIEI